MCDYFWKRLEKSQGDLTDIFQGSAFGAPATAADIPTAITETSQQPTPDPAAALPSSTDGFFDNFAVDSKDPMLHELVGTGFFGSTEKTVANKSFPSMSITVIRQPSPPPLVGLADTAKVSSGVSIPSPQTPAIKRRKNQARKVVCIPAPAVASNKPGGEVVPSDLWAWRKYGQKPIKGSPYPRGYYRCSSSKGCSARKQVERSRTDPNMLVITYTSDHNHPWPTQKNALAGSTRSQSSKNNNNASSSKTSSFNQKLPAENITIREEEEEEEAKWSSISSSFPSVTKIKEMEKSSAAEQLDVDFNQAFHKSFNELEPDDFFADLAVLDGDPMSLDGEKNNNNAMNYFNMLGWNGGNSFGVRKRS